jgi:hypothetical protein
MGRAFHHDAAHDLADDIVVLVLPLAGRARRGRAFEGQAGSHCSISQMAAIAARIVPTLMTAAHTNGATKLGGWRPRCRVFCENYGAPSADKASTPRSAKFIVILKIDGWNPIATSVRISRTHHFDAIPEAVSLDGDLIATFVAPTVAGANIRVEESSYSNGHVSERWMESLALPVLDALTLPQLAGDDIDPMYGIGWIAAAHDGIANRRERASSVRFEQCAVPLPPAA